MKTSLLLITILGLATSNGSAVKEVRCTLGDSLAEVMVLVPTDEVIDVLVHFIQTDPDVEAAFEYLGSPQFRIIATALDNQPEFTKFLQYLESNGIDIYEFLNELRQLIGVPTLAPVVSRRQLSSRNLNDMLNAMLAVLPLREIKALVEYKLEHDLNVQNLVQQMRRSEFRQLVNTLRELPEFQRMLKGMREQGVDVDTWLKAVSKFFGWY